MSLGVIIVFVWEGKGVGHVVHGESLVLDGATLATQPPALLLVSYSLILIIQWSPQSLLELVFY